VKLLSSEPADVPRVRRSRKPPTPVAQAVTSAAQATRVLVLTAPVGEGHVAAARVLSADIRRRSEAVVVEVCDVLPALPAPLRWVLSDAYRWQLGTAPWLFEALFGALRRSRVLRRIARAGLSLAGSRSLGRLVRGHPADVIVSTWPAATTILGCLRQRGKVRVPVCATITDFAGLELWADKGVDLHLVMHESLVPKIEHVAGRGSARHVSPLVAGEFLEPRSRVQARRALGLPVDGTIVVVSGGGWGVGDLSGAIETALQVEGSTVVCLAGRDDANRERLEHAFAGESRVRVLGFSDRMTDLLAAADVLVHSTGGVTTLEALARGCPVVAYGAPRGHAPLLAREMAALGLISHARSTAELKASLLTVPTEPSITLTPGADAARLVLELEPRVELSSHTRLTRTAAMAVALTAMAFAFFASDVTYPVVAEALALPEATSISTNRHAVALVIRGHPRTLLELAPLARGLHLRASVAISGPMSSAGVARLRRAGLDPIPELRARGVRSWFDVSQQLGEQRSLYGLGPSFYYLAPDDGFTLTDYLLARRLGGRPLRGTSVSTAGSAPSLHAREILVFTLEPDRAPIRAALRGLIRELERSRLAISSVQRLASHPAG